MKQTGNEYGESQDHGDGESPGHGISNETRVYPLGCGLSREEMAVTFAMTSRSGQPFDEIAEQVKTSGTSPEFHEKWVLGYGHSSVAEHAVLHLAIENVSRLACDALEDCRLASYTEQSSRYQVMTDVGFHVPAELDNLPEAGESFRRTGEELFRRYEGLLHSLREHLQDTEPAGEGESAPAHRHRLRRMATDAARGVLPAAAHTNVGLTINARNLAHAVGKLRSSEIMEERRLGEELLGAGMRVTPTLLKHAGPTLYLRESMRRENWQVTRSRPVPPAARILDYDADAARRIAEAILYRELPMDLAQIRDYVESMDHAERIEIIGRRMRHLGDHDAAIREFEIPHLTLELLLDYGAYREFRRHRMQSCFPQPLTIRLGHRVPALIREAGLEERFIEAIHIAEEGCQRVAEVSMNAAAYLVTHAHHRALIARMNLREAYHVFQLRTSPEAHESIREPMLEALTQAVAAMPDLFQWLRLRDYPEWWPKD